MTESNQEEHPSASGVPDGAELLRTVIVKEWKAHQALWIAVALIALAACTLSPLWSSDSSYMLGFFNGLSLVAALALMGVLLCFFSVRKRIASMKESEKLAEQVQKAAFELAIPYVVIIVFSQLLQSSFAR